MQLFLVVLEGAVLDASGTSAVLDIPGQGATTVASHGGLISLSSSRGLYLDGDMRANAGGAGAAGGSFSLSIGSAGAIGTNPSQIGRASGRERVCQYV